jgi:hypothetical protein
VPAAAKIRTANLRPLVSNSREAQILILRCRPRSRPLLFIFIMTCSALVLHGASAKGQETVEDFPPTGNYKLTGSVVNSVTGEPISRARVTDNIHAVLTDAEGKFEIDGMTQGLTTIDVTKPGFFREGEHHVGRGYSYSSPSVRIGPDSAPITLRLIPEAVIYGKVESDGEPVGDLAIRLIQQVVIEGRRQLVVLGSTVTNDDGEFRIPDLVAGTYYLSAGPSSTQSASLTEASRQFDRGYGETFYPQASDLAGAAPISISAGEQTEADFSLKTTRLFKISGTIVGASGQGANLQFTNSAGEAAQFPVHYNPATGGFETMAPAGAYTLKAEVSTMTRQMMEGSLPLNIRSDMTGIRLTLALAVSIPIEVRKDAVLPADTHHSSASISGMDINGRTYEIDSNDGSLVQIVLEPRSQSLQNQHYVSTYRMAGDMPIMEIENVEPGQYIASISAGQMWYVESAQCGSVDLLREELLVAPGMQPPPISLVLRDDPAQVSGQVSSGGKPAGGAVLIIPEGRHWETSEIAANKQGNYLAQGLAPGEYDVLAVDHAQDLEYTNPEVLRLYLPRAQHIVLQPNQKAQLNLEIGKGEPE